MIDLGDVEISLQFVQQFVDTLDVNHPARVEWERAKAWISDAVQTRRDNEDE